MGRTRAWFPLSLLAVSSAVMAAPADDIKSLLEQGKPAEAYQTGKRTPDQLGDPVFDFFYGIAALESGIPGEGVLALERYVLSYPENRSARFHLGRGYFILGEDERARDEFEGLRSAATGEEKVAVERFLDAIRARESRYQPTANAFVEVGIGYDNNITYGVDQGKSVFGTPADPLNVTTREKDFYESHTAGVQGTYPLAPGVALFGSLGAEGKSFLKSRNDVFDQLGYGGGGGISYLTGRNLYRVGVSIFEMRVDNQHFLTSPSLSVDWTYTLDQSNRFVLGATVGEHDYDNTLVYATKNKTGGKMSSGAAAKTDNFYSLSAGWTHVFAAPYQPILNLALNYGQEDNQRNREDFSRDLYMARAHLSLTPAPRWAAALGVSYLEARHQGAFGNGALPGQPKRVDTYVGLDLMVSYQIDKAWSARVEAGWAKQDSNVSLFDYDRSWGAAKLRYEFN